MTPDDYQRMNDILIIQAGEMEIAIQGQADRIRDLEARAACWKRTARYYWKGQKMAIAQTRPWFDRTNAAEAEVAEWKKEYKRLQLEYERLCGLCPYETDPAKRAKMEYNQHEPKPVYLIEKWD